MLTPAQMIEGRHLNGGWTVGARIVRTGDATGGQFSESYYVRNQDGRSGFLKALDYSSALRSPDPARHLQSLTAAFNFERDVLAIARGMDRVVRAIDDGVVEVDPNSPIGKVQYIVFEAADFDVRHVLSTGRDLDHVWKLRCLHNIATGLKQLHGAGIAHQDLKPSNVLVFQGSGGHVSKVADLGCAAMKGKLGPRDECAFAGDGEYAPPELVYRYIDPDWSQRRLGCDLYLMGSMIAFVFSYASMSGLLFSCLDESLHPQVTAARYPDLLPYIAKAHADSLTLLRSSIDAPLGTRDVLVNMVASLCDPEPSRRLYGGARNLQGTLERVVSRLDLEARKAKIELARNHRAVKGDMVS